jgi:GDPmannose 4,6-dehydratase
VRDWSHARDVVHGYHLMLAQDEPGDYVLASGVGRTVGDLVAAAFAVVGLDPERYVRSDAKFIRPSERTPPVGDISLARERLGWEPETSFEAMIEEMVRADLVALQATGAGARGR